MATLQLEATQVDKKKSRRGEEKAEDTTSSIRKKGSTIPSESEGGVEVVQFSKKRISKTRRGGKPSSSKTWMRLALS